jgi:hypothetical protein
MTETQWYYADIGQQRQGPLPTGAFWKRPMPARTWSPWPRAHAMYCSRPCACCHCNSINGLSRNES